jgi:hypothetical protein
LKPNAGGMLPDLACRLKSDAEGAAGEVADYDCEYDGHDGCGLCFHEFVSAWGSEDFMERPRKVELDRKSTLLVHGFAS